MTIELGHATDRKLPFKYAAFTRVGFSDTDPGTSPVTSYEVSATDRNHPMAPPVTASGPSSPIVVTGLTNGDPYLFTVTATSADGTSPPSAAT